MHTNKTTIKIAALALVLALLIAGVFLVLHRQQRSERHDSTTFAMDTLVTQTAYGPRAEAAMQEVEAALMEFEARLSLYNPTSDIAAINAAAGDAAGATVQPQTADFLQRAVDMSLQSENAFAISIAPLTLAWGINSDTPRVLEQDEIDTLLPLVDDTSIKIHGSNVILGEAGMALDLGGIAKGEACSVAAAVYDAHGVESALLWIGGNTYARGAKPDGTPWRVGLRNPYIGGDAYIASFDMVDMVLAVSDGTERNFTADGETFIHILDPRTGRPAESDIISVGVFDPDGAAADFYSTTLYVWGLERSLEYMQSGGMAVILDGDNTLYVSEALRESFALYEATQDDFTVVFVEAA